MERREKHWRKTEEEAAIYRVCTASSPIPHTRESEEEVFSLDKTSELKGEIKRQLKIIDVETQTERSYSNYINSCFLS